jgi:hypothetical protein
MKDKNCVDLKMAAYCQGMHDLEGKFHRLKLHHVLRDYNKAADMLAKTASSRKLVPEGFLGRSTRALCTRRGGEATRGRRTQSHGGRSTARVESRGSRLVVPDQTEARRIARRAKAFILIKGELYVDS